MQGMDLDELFGLARRAGPVPSAALAARIEADALALQRSRAAPVPRPRPRRPRWSAWIGALGGGSAVAGLGTATLAGLWLGFAQPVPVLALTETVSAAFAADAGGDAVNLLPALDAFVLEG